MQRFVKMLCCLVVLLLAASPGQAQGPVVLMGIDAEDLGPGGHGPIEVYVDVVNSVLNQAAALGNTGSGILVIGGGKDPMDHVTLFWEAIAAQITPNMTFVNGAANITNTSFAGYQMIAVVSSGALQGVQSGGITQAENDALAARQADIAAFINTEHGGLLGFSQTGLNNLYAYVTGIGAFSVVTSLSYTDITPSPEGILLGITNLLDVCCWHDVYQTFPSFLNILATHNIMNQPEFGMAAAVGGFIQIPGIVLAPDSSTNVVGGMHTVTATVTDMLGNPQPNIMVSFSVVSGPNAGLAGSDVTDANGAATFTYTGAGGPGTDNLRAAFVDVNGNTVLSNTVTKVWVSSLRCDLEIISPIEGATVCREMEVIAIHRVTGGDPPYTRQCNINGLPVMMSGDTLSITMPCTDTIIALCRVQDQTDTEVVCSDTIKVICAPPLDCAMQITVPQDSLIVCDSTIFVEGTLTVTGGTNPLTITGNVNGIPAAVIGSTFSVNVPLAAGWNDLLASFTVADSCNLTVTCSDVVSVFLDREPPYCEFSPDGLDVIGTVYDDHSGIQTFFAQKIKNGQFFPDPFVPGAKAVNFRVERIDPNEKLTFNLLMTDMCGNQGNCDPVLLNLPAGETTTHDFTFSDMDRYFNITNHGLSAIYFILNGRPFSLFTDPRRVANSFNAFLMPYEGDVSFDMLPYLVEGENNRMHVRLEGPHGATAELVLADVGFEENSPFDLQELPQDFTLAQNYPNPFNPVTHIEYTVPATKSDGVPVRLIIYNVLGEVVRTLVDERQYPGLYTITWDATDARANPVPSGLYLYRLQAGEAKLTRRMLLLK